jgi:hypothetical protein
MWSSNTRRLLGHVMVASKVQRALRNHRNLQQDAREKHDSGPSRYRGF